MKKKKKKKEITNRQWKNEQFLLMSQIFQQDNDLNILQKLQRNILKIRESMS